MGSRKASDRISLFSSHLSAAYLTVGYWCGVKHNPKPSVLQLDSHRPDTQIGQQGGSIQPRGKLLVGSKFKGL